MWFFFLPDVISNSFPEFQPLFPQPLQAVYLQLYSHNEPTNLFFEPDLAYMGLFVVYSECVFVRASMRTCWLTCSEAPCGDQRTFLVVDFLSTMCVLGSNWGPHTWWQSPLPIVFSPALSISLHVCVFHITCKCAQGFFMACSVKKLNTSQLHSCYFYLIIFVFLKTWSLHVSPNCSGTHRNPPLPTECWRWRNEQLHQGDPHFRALNPGPESLKKKNKCQAIAPLGYIATPTSWWGVYAVESPIRMLTAVL